MVQESQEKVHLTFWSMPMKLFHRTRFNEVYVTVKASLCTSWRRMV